ncbi:MAG: primosomal protein N' [Patescibacteria group bacterium]|nr:primosomal protein N' [Patescibacteria group bacterium]
MIKSKKLIARVVPAVKLPRGVSQIFSYAIPKKMENKIQTGTIVEIPFRKKNIFGIVLDIKKEEIKNIKFKLKEISNLPEKELNLSNQQIQLAKFVSSYYYVPLNLVAKIIVPLITKSKPRKEIDLNHNCKIPNIKKTEINKLLEEIKKKDKILFIHNLQAERHNLYSEIIKKNIKGKAQALLLFPENFDVYNFASFYKNEFKENKIAQLTGELTKNQYFNEWQKIEDGSAKIIIGTRQAIFAPFKNLKLVIADDEHNSSYKQWDQNPRYHGIEVVKELTKIWKAKIILSSPAPSIKSYYEIKNKLYLFKNSSQKEEKITLPNLIDINTERQKGNYSVLSEDLQNNLMENIYNRKQAIIFIPRLGNDTITQCKECNWIAECENCDTILTSYTNYLYCPKCQKKIEFIKKCPKCQGQNISSFGYGSEKIEKEIKKLFENKNIKINRLDSETASNKSKQSKILKDFINKKVDILIGTQMVLKNWNLENLALTAILFPEIIFNQPEFNSHEKSFQFLMSTCIKANCNHQLIIQTRKPDNSLFETVLKIIKTGNIHKFYSDEIKNRSAILENKIGYPPFAQLTKLIYKNFSSQNCQIEAEKMFKDLNNKIASDKSLKNKFEIIKPFPASNYKEFNKYRWHIVIKSTYENTKLRDSLLACVKKDWIIDIDPDTIL